MPTPKFSLNYKDTGELLKLVRKIDHKILGRWALACAQRVLPYFEKKYPKDSRPQIALNTLKTWIKTEVFKMSVIRKASLDSHAAARHVGEDNSARSAARAAGQAVATAHVKTHSLAAANYALQAIFRASPLEKAEKMVAKERAWQIRKLKKL